MGVFLRAGKLNNRQDPLRLGVISRQNPEVTYLTQADNIDFDNGQMATMRLGRSQLLAGVPHSLWSHPHDDTIAFFVDASRLRRLNTDYTATTLALLNSNNPMCFCLVNGEVVASNAVDIGWVSQGQYDPFAPTLGQFEIAMPACQYLTMLNGVLYGARGSVIFASKPHDIERCDERFSQMPMNGYIRMLGAVEDGLWAATDRDRVAFISGGGVDDFSYVDRCDDIPPDGAFVEDWWEENGVQQRCVVWPSKSGFVVGLAGGRLKYLDSDNIAIPPGASGRCFSRKINGIHQYVAVILDPDTADTFTPPSLVVTTHTVS
jgi:hypothetical protein